MWAKNVGGKVWKWMTKTQRTVLFTLFLPPSCYTNEEKKNVSPVPAQHQVEFVAYGQELIGISLMIPTAPTMLAYGLVADIFERERRVG